MSDFYVSPKRDTPALPPPAGPLDEAGRKFISKAFAEFSQVPEKWLSGLFSLIQVEQPSIDQIPGRTAYAPQLAQVLTAEDLTGTTSYSDLSTAGPTISNLGPGSYVAFWFAMVLQTGGLPGNPAQPYMGLMVNGSEAADAVAATTVQAAGSGAILNFLTGTLTATTNSVKARYRIDDAAGTYRFARRNLLVLKVG